MYDDFASVYDRLMDDFDYPAWAEFYLALCEGRSRRPESIVDCACGTGSMSLEFARRGHCVIGVDRSEAMLAVAADKARAVGLRVDWVRQDMRALALHRPADALFACCDGVNYLLSERDVRSFFRAAARCVAPGGTLAFDISSRHKLAGQMGDAFFGEEREDIAYLWQNRYHPAARRIEMDLTFFVRQPGGLYRRFSEKHAQRAHEAAELTAWLADCGFENIAVYGDRVLRPPAADEARIHFVAGRAV